jgi:hypothetical protein
MTLNDAILTKMVMICSPVPRISKKLERRLAAGFQRDFLGKAECNPALRFPGIPVRLFFLYPGLTWRAGWGKLANKTYE